MSRGATIIGDSFWNYSVFCFLPSRRTLQDTAG
jgi:hypothetical protein